MSASDTVQLAILFAECLLMSLVLHGASGTVASADSGTSDCMAPIHTIQVTNQISESVFFNRSCEEFGQLLYMAEEQLRITNQILDRVNQTMVCAPGDAVIEAPSESDGGGDAPGGLTQIYDSALRPSDCAEVLELGGTESGVYTIYPSYGEDPFFVFCDMETDGGGWTVFQRRINGSVDFYRKWADYKFGFGRAGGEYWLGNEKIHRMTSQKEYELRIDMADWENETRYASYDSFELTGESDHYRLTVGTYGGTAGDALDHHNGKKFSTEDSDNDLFRGSCASIHHAGWWYGACHRSNLNGRYHEGGSGAPRSDAVNWYYWKSYEYSLKETMMKMRPKN